MSESPVRRRRKGIGSPAGGVVDQNVDGAECGFGRIEQAGGGADVLQVCLERDSATALPGDRR